jgi:hypothetical protein
VVTYFYDGTYFNQMGSNDITDADTTITSNLVGDEPNSRTVLPTTFIQSGTFNYGFIAYVDEGLAAEAVSTAPSTTSGARMFSTNPLKLFRPILYYFGAGSWVSGINLGPSLARYNLGTNNWKYAIGQYYNKSGTLVPNTDTVDLLGAPLYVGGTMSGDDAFLPSEYSLTLRDTTKVYKQIGQFSTPGNFTFQNEQPVYIYAAGAWRRYVAGGTMIEVSSVPATGQPGVVFYTTN